MSEYTSSDAGGDGTGSGSGTGTGTPTGSAAAVPAPDLGVSHQAWLAAQQATLSAGLRDQWRSSDEWNTDIVTYELDHYSRFDNGPLILWRFTSQPSTEFIQITAGKGLAAIIAVIAAHSGGADKSNPDVKTSSLCRNPGALLGTAASTGGDKKVLNIINRAGYLFGIDVSTLAARGVSAHPALSRTISVIETEYVLVPTPGQAACSLDQLAARKWPNPFKGRIGVDGTVSGSTVKLPISDPQGGYASLSAEQAPLTPNLVVTNGQMADADADAMLKFAANASKAASKQSGAIQDKEPVDLNIMIKIAQQHLSLMK